MHDRTTRLRSQLSTNPGFAERGQVAPGTKEAFLDRVSRELVVPEDQSGSRIQPCDERAGQHREGLMIRLAALARRALAGPRPPSGFGAAIKSRSECKSPCSAKGFPGRGPDIESAVAVGPDEQHRAHDVNTRKKPTVMARSSIGGWRTAAAYSGFPQ